MTTAPTTSPTPVAAAPVAAEAPCAHCGLPVGPRPVLAGDGAACCCTGCAVVRDALAAAGFSGDYYRLRELAPSRGSARPASPDDLAAAALDAPGFLERHTRALDGGLRQVDLFVDGVHCAACVWLVERLPFEVEGVQAARLDLPRARVTLTFDPARVDLSAVARWLARFGYTARPAEAGATGRATAAERSLLLRTGVAWALAGNVMLVAFAMYSGLDVGEDPALATAARWVSLALALPSVAYGGAPFLTRAWASLRAAAAARDPRRLHMDVPLALGILAGFAHSAVATVTGRGEVWFDSIAVLVAALLTARWLQLRARRVAGEAGERLLALVPGVARRLRDGGPPEVVAVRDLRAGDRVEIPAGEVLPVDGVVVRGESRVDNAVLTGESRPERVAEGSSVAAGATNLQRPITVRVDAAGDDTRVGRLLAWVREADGRRAPVVLLADRLAGVFTLSVLALSVGAAALWLVLDPPRALPVVAALLVVTCPCALGMATPLAFAVAAGRAARRGVYVKTEAATQRLTEVDAVVLDKTGTLTEGRMTLAASAGDDRALDLAAALEAHSNHPLAAAFVRARGVDDMLIVGDVEAVAGSGLRGTVDGRRVVVGRPAWVEAEAGPMPDALRQAALDGALDGHTPVAIAVEGAVAAVAVVGDALRPEAAALVRMLAAEGKEVHLLSGDHPAAVAVVARKLGLPPTNARGGVSPEGKRDAVDDLRARGRTVLVVGDGVNDAAALRAADVGVAVGGGTTASLVAADVFLTRPGLAPLEEALVGARQTMRTVRTALGVSLVYNAAGAALAVAGLVTPLVAAVAMPVSSLAVVALALTQPAFRRPTTDHGPL